VKLRLLSKTEGCQALSPEDKNQMWNDTLENKTDISAKYGKKLLIHMQQWQVKLKRAKNILQYTAYVLLK
jgi:hypothetical protein